ncbi:MAG: tetratricopeptide repeat protein [Thermotogae bacterium]|nr:tetratricopeptide repeat protein [Thermotogota bacterium]
MKRVFLIGVFALWLGTSCVTLQEQKPKLTLQERIDSAQVWHSIGKDDLLKAVDGRATYETAINELRKAYSYTLAKDTTGKLDSLRKEIALDLAYAYLRNKQLDSAEVFYQRIIKMDSTDPRGWHGLGFLYGIVKEDYVKGEEFYKKALELSPDNPDVLFGLAKVYEKAGEDEKAMNLYKEALQRKPDNAALNKSFGVFLYEKGKYAEAITYLEKAYEKRKDDFELLKTLTDAYLKASKEKKDVDLEKALTYATALIELADTSQKYKYYLKRAKIYEKLGKKKEAIADYERALKLNPNAKALKVRIAYLYDDLGQTAKAEKLAREVINDKEIDPQYRAPAWTLLGDIRQRRAIALYKAKKYEQAVSTFDSAIAAYQQAVVLGSGSIKTYAQRQLERVRKWRKKAWRKWKRID